MLRLVPAVLIACEACFAQMSAIEIVRRSVAVNNEDWKAGPSFSNRERDADSGKPIQSFEVTMLEGSPFRRLIAIHDQPLAPARQRAELKKQEREAERRRNESPSERATRIAAYQKERAQDHLLMNEMTRAFVFHLAGEEEISGVAAYVLDATPRPDYKPVNRDARVLTGMKGRLWIDKSHFHWVKVEAEVVRPVWFAGFLARVGPGTRFVLEQAPVSDDTWQPRHFTMRVKASVVGIGRNSSSDETYSEYRREKAVVAKAR